MYGCTSARGAQRDWTDPQDGDVLPHPVHLIAWIPIIGLFGGAVSTLYPLVVGIRELNHVSSRRAAGAACTAAIVPVIALFGVIMAFVAPVPMLSFLTPKLGRQQPPTAHICWRHR